MLEHNVTRRLRLTAMSDPFRNSKWGAAYRLWARGHNENAHGRHGWARGSYGCMDCPPSLGAAMTRPRHVALPPFPEPIPQPAPHHIGATQVRERYGHLGWTLDWLKKASHAGVAPNYTRNNPFSPRLWQLAELDRLAAGTWKPGLAPKRFVLHEHHEHLHMHLDRPSRPKRKPTKKHGENDDSAPD